MRIPEVDLVRWTEIAETARIDRVPVVIRGSFSKLASTWNPDRLAQELPDLEVDYTDDLPSHGVPYREASDHHRSSTTLRQFVALLQSGRHCYLNQAPVRMFPCLAKDLDGTGLALDRTLGINVWLGGVTRSGLHFDHADNLFAQVYGRKHAILVNPSESRFIYPFPDNPSKSQVDPENPDLELFPRFVRCRLWCAELNAGDALFIPRGWWHYIASNEISISLNFWHGETLTDLEQVRLFLGGGPKVLLCAVRDFVYHGLLGKPYMSRMFSPDSPGIRAYNLIARRSR